MRQAVVLFVASTPASPRSITLDEEMREVGRWLRPSSCPVSLIFRACWTVTPEPLERALADAPLAILHVSGRGAAPGDSAVTDRAALRELLRGGAGRVRIVVLDGYHDDEFARAVAEDVDCVLRVPPSIGDGDAKVLVGCFYMVLAFGRDAEEAFQRAMVATDFDVIERGSEPRLLVRKGVITSDVQLSVLPTDTVPAWTLARARQLIAETHDMRPGPGPGACRMIVRLDGSLAELQGERPAALERLLRERAGDETFLVEKIADGGVGLLIATTAAGRARLLTSIESRELTELDQLPIVSAETDLSPDWMLDGDDTSRESIYLPPMSEDVSFNDRWLVVSSEAGEPISEVWLTLAHVDEVLIGRGRERQHSSGNRRLLLVLADRQVSRLHLRLSRTADGWALDDVGSVNGTRVNGRSVAHCKLIDGDIIEISRSVLVYRQENRP